MFVSNISTDVSNQNNDRITRVTEELYERLMDENFKFNEIPSNIDELIQHIGNIETKRYLDTEFMRKFTCVCGGILRYDTDLFTEEQLSILESYNRAGIKNIDTRAKKRHTNKHNMDFRRNMGDIGSRWFDILSANEDEDPEKVVGFEARANEDYTDAANFADTIKKRYYSSYMSSLAGDISKKAFEIYDNPDSFERAIRSYESALRKLEYFHGKERMKSFISENMGDLETKRYEQTNDIGQLKKACSHYLDAANFDRKIYNTNSFNVNMYKAGKTAQKIFECGEGDEYLLAYEDCLEKKQSDVSLRHI